MPCSIWRPREDLHKVCLHVFLDGRDTPPKSAEIYLRRLTDKIRPDSAVGHIASIIGRYYAMDRDHRWQRVKAAYDLLTQGQRRIPGREAAGAGLEAAYARDENDEFVKATAILPPDGKPVKMEDGDGVIFMNFRSDRARQLSAPVHRTRFRRVRARGDAAPGHLLHADRLQRRLRRVGGVPAGAHQERLRRIHLPTSACASCASRKPKNMPTSRSSSTAARKSPSPAKTACWCRRPTWPPTISSRK